jgi:adenosylmethionine-8-amino-7-oxononanoate aminotransferase
MIGDVRGAGLLQGVEFVKDPHTGERFPPTVRPGKVVEREARERGLILRCGEDFAALAPPLVVTAQDIDDMCGILAQSIAVAQQNLLGVAR